jgi:biopolymer transport protein ExbB/TolQ
MTITDYFFIALSLIAGLSMYCFVNKFNESLPDVIYRLEKCLAMLAAIIGMLGTVSGLYIAVKSGLTEASITVGLSLAMPTTMAGLITTIFCSILTALKPSDGVCDE